MRILRGMRRMMACAALAAAVICCGVSPAHADRDSMRAHLKEKGDAVITLEVVMDVKFAGWGSQYDGERKSEGFGTVISEDGLVVTALSSVDPASFLGQSMGEDMKYETRVKSMRYIMPDNEEIEAAVVLRDPDLSLAYLKPLEKREKPYTYISLEDNVAAKAEILEDVWVIGRLPRIGRRNIAAMTGEVQAIIDRPRTMYITDGEISSANPGTPVFTGRNQLLGFNGMYIRPGRPMTNSEDDRPYIQIVLPVSDVKEGMDQARGIEPKPIATSAADEETSPTEATTE